MIMIVWGLWLVFCCIFRIGMFCRFCVIWYFTHIGFFLVDFWVCLVLCFDCLFLFKARLCCLLWFFRLLNFVFIFCGFPPSFTVKIFFIVPPCALSVKSIFGYSFFVCDGVICWDVKFPFFRVRTDNIVDFRRGFHSTLRCATWPYKSFFYGQSLVYAIIFYICCVGGCCTVNFTPESPICPWYWTKSIWTPSNRTSAAETPETKKSAEKTKTYNLIHPKTLARTQYPPYM